MSKAKSFDFMDPRPTPPLHKEKAEARLVWVLDGERMYLKTFPYWRLYDDGTVEVEGRKLKWFEAKEFK